MILILAKDFFFVNIEVNNEIFLQNEIQVTIVQKSFNRNEKETLKDVCKLGEHCIQIQNIKQIILFSLFFFSTEKNVLGSEIILLGIRFMYMVIPSIYNSNEILTYFPWTIKWQQIVKRRLSKWANCPTLSSESLTEEEVSFVEVRK